MGSSTSRRGSPAWQSRNTPGADPKVSKGSIVHAEGTHQSGHDDHGRDGMGGARKKSAARKTSARNPGPHGYS
jgi:hypothetical protein